MQHGGGIFQGTFDVGGKRGVVGLFEAHFYQAPEDDAHVEKEVVGIGVSAEAAFGFAAFDDFAALLLPDEFVVAV